MCAIGSNSWRSRFGLAAERYAASYLEAAGLTILERRYRCRQGEIDLVARDGSMLVFVEVKARRGRRFGEPAEAVGWRKQRCLAAAARHYLRQRAGSAPAARFDVLSIASRNGRLEVDWIRDAFRV